MHTYRDAIPAARSAWVLYPGTETRFFAASPGAGRGHDGVGVLPARPGISEVGLLMRAMLPA